MPITDTDKTDFLWKKVLFGVSKTAAGAAKGGPNETIPSPLPVFGSDVWSQTTAQDIPADPPTDSTSIVERRYGAEAVQCTPDPTSPPNVAWLATPEFGTPTAIDGDWIPPTFGADYVVRVWIGNPQGGPAARIFPDAVNEEWVFDYSAGVLFFPNSIPSPRTATVGSGTVSVSIHGIYIEGFRYIGTKGVGGGGVFSLLPTGVVAGTYSFATIAVDADGRISFAASSDGAGSGPEIDTLDTVVARGSESSLPISITDETDGALVVSGGGFFARDVVVGSAPGGGRVELDYETAGGSGFWLIEVDEDPLAESRMRIGVNRITGTYRSLIAMTASGVIVGTPYELSLFAPTITPSAVAAATLFNRASRFAAVDTPFGVRLLDAPSDNMIFILRRNGAQIGTVAFVAGNGAGQASLLPNLLFVPGDVVTIATADTDATAAGLLVTLSLQYE